MIRVEVLHLKAPWPAGVTVGAVVALAVASLPAWAAGKCVLLPADDEREPVATWEPPQIDSSDPQARAFVVNPAAAADQLAEQAVRVAELGQQLLDAEQALGTALAEIASLVAERDAAQAELQALRSVPVGTITGDGTGEALLPVEEPKAAPAKATKKAAA
ncbi:hypothetical protein [Aquabacterium sp. OR-4]|uniref:hypothetical protein n=1 Tax=Aquabacterium sp. OR-4 TaxID=2978127 RepID=UPI0021B25EB5|nr:hypothetical protein [Aquabacterium sp. OR-4]MDT7834968.1 hypothetical protein [Aquabacterium sp. OR-4]